MLFCSNKVVAFCATFIFFHNVLACDLVIKGKTVFSLSGAFPCLFSQGYHQISDAIDRIKNENDAATTLHTIVTSSNDTAQLKKFIDYCAEEKISCPLNQPIDGIAPVLWAIKYRKYAIALELLKTHKVSAKDINPLKLLNSEKKQHLFYCALKQEKWNIDTLLQNAITSKIWML